MVGPISTWTQPWQAEVLLFRALAVFLRFGAVQVSILRCEMFGSCEEAWYRNLVKFRHALYAKDIHKIERFTLRYSDLVKSIMNENAEDQVCMMLMLQDGSHYLLDETTSEAVSSLKSCLNQLRRSKKLRLEGQLLVTVTTVLLDSDIVDRRELSELVDLLGDMVLQVKRNHPFIRSSACSCLGEIELRFPGTLDGWLERLWLALAKDTSWAAPSLAQLLAHHLPMPPADKMALVMGLVAAATPLLGATLLRWLLSVPHGLVELSQVLERPFHEVPLLQLHAGEDVLELLLPARTSVQPMELLLNWLGSLPLTETSVDVLAAWPLSVDHQTCLRSQLHSLRHWVGAVQSRFAVHALLHSLYQLHSQHLLSQEIARLVVNLATLPAFYCSSLLNFVRCIRVAAPNRQVV